MNQRMIGLILLLLLGACATPAATQHASKAQGQHAAASQQPAAPALDDQNGPLSGRSIYFGFDSFLVNDEYRNMLMAHANYLITHPAAEILVQGNTDERGGREYNLALGNRRAGEVRRLMTLLGAAPRQIDPVSFGKERPFATCHNESCWQKNRRADILYKVAQ